jgi:hypothetical protein
MKPVDQTTFGFPGGNCFSACVASLLELSIDDVPYLMDDDEWYLHFRRWLAPRGFYPLCFVLDGGWTPDGLHILSGKSPRDPDNQKALHSVVARGSEIAHDPHPSRAGLLRRDDVVVLIPLDPMRSGATRKAST